MSARGSLISVRITDELQRRLKAIADARGMTVSDLVRSLFDDLLQPPTPPAETRAVRPQILGDLGGVGVIWHEEPGMVIDGNMITLSAQRSAEGAPKEKP